MASRTSNIRLYASFAIVVITCAFGSFTQTVMNAMFGGITASFGTDDSLNQWLTTSFMLTIGITVPLVTHLSRRFRTKTLVLWALGLFFAGAVIDFLAPNFIVLLLGRIPQAASAGITMPVLQSMSMTHFPKGKNATAMGVAGIALGFAPNIGPLIGGALVDSLGWRSFFAMIAAVIALLTLAACLVIKDDHSEEHSAHLDMLSFALSTIGFGSLLLSFTNAANMSLANVLVWGPLLIGAACVAWFILRQKKLEHPLISMRVFESKRFTISFIAQNCLFASFMGITLVIPLFVQDISGLSALDAGIVFLPATISAIFVNPIAGILADKVGTRKVVIVASCMMLLSALSFVFVGPETPLWMLATLQLVRSMGVSSLIGPLNTWGMSQLPHTLMVDASAFFITIRQACASLGTAAMMFCISLFVGTTGAVMGYHIAFGISAVLALMVLACTLFKVRD